MANLLGDAAPPALPRLSRPTPMTWAGPGLAAAECLPASRGPDHAGRHSGWHRRATPRLWNPPSSSARQGARHGTSVIVSHDERQPSTRRRDPPTW